MKVRDAVGISTQFTLALDVRREVLIIDCVYTAIYQNVTQGTTELSFIPELQRRGLRIN